METLAFDGRMGASGDLLLGALLAAGADRSALDPVEEALDLQYVVSETTRSGIAATAVDVILDEEDAAPSVESEEHTHDDASAAHTLDHSSEENGHHQPSEQDHHRSPDDQADEHASPDTDRDHSHGDPAEGHGPHRAYTEVVDLVESMALPERVEQRARSVFERLGRAEATIHGTDLQSTEFHEVGADDAIADIVGVSLLLSDLDPGRIVTTPVAAGGGERRMSHGVYPIPAPAVVEIATAADWLMRGGPIESELLTPTGAAILAEVAEGVDSLPTLAVEHSGYGAGSNSFEGRANVLRAIVGSEQAGLRQDSITVLETNLDDATPETLGSLQATLSSAGALDVTVLPATMKKARPGHLLKVIVKPENADRVARKLAAETGTLGVREHGTGHRFVADRRIEPVSVELDGREFDVAVKIASFGDDGAVFDVSAESDDAETVAEQTGVPVREVRRRAEAAARENID